MRPFLACFATALALVTPPLIGGPSPVPDEVYLSEGGARRPLVIARDEVWDHKPGQPGGIRTLSPATSARELGSRLNRTTRTSDTRSYLVAYPAGSPRNDYTRRVLTEKVSAELAPGTDPEALRAAVGAATVTSVDFLPGWHVFTAAELTGGIALADALRSQPGVLQAETLTGRRRQLKLRPNDTLFTNQWHLITNKFAKVDINVSNVWNTYRGSNMVIGIVDDALQWTHPDLTNNYTPTGSWDWADGDSNPLPNVAEDWHGTSCAGLAAAQGSNNLGVCGVAYQAKLAGLRLIGMGNNLVTDLEEADAMTRSNAFIHIKSNSWGAGDGGYDYDGGGPLWRAAVSTATTTGRDGKGTIFTWAAGNGGPPDNANYDSYANSIYVLAVGAIDDQGTNTTYSEPGANIVVVAPSSDETPRQGITTTDLTGNNGYNPGTGEAGDVNYTRTFGGTSAATPIVAGACALILQANPQLGWRDMKEILIRSATKNHAASTGWATNSAGLRFHHSYGAGLLNVHAAVALATNNWLNLGPMTNTVLAVSNLNLSIADNNATGVSTTLRLTNTGLRVEHVTVTVGASHTYRGDLKVELTNPSGMKSILQEVHEEDDHGDIPGWTFTSVRHWGEKSDGVWTLRVNDGAAGDTGRLNYVRLEVFGTAAGNLGLIASTPEEKPGVSNGNGTIDPGETIRETLALRNNGANSAFAISGTLSTDSPGVTLLQNVSTYPNAARGTTITNDTTFEYRVARDVPFGTNLVFTHVVTGTGAGTTTNIFTRFVGSVLATNYATNFITYTNLNRSVTNGSSASGTTVIGVTNTFNVGTNRILDDLDVYLRHDSTELLLVSFHLLAPDGNGVKLLGEYQADGTNFGTGTSSYNYTILDDQAPQHIGGGVAPYTNRFVGATPLSALNGMTVGSTWILRVQNGWGTDFPSPAALLRSWGLRFVTHQNITTGSIYNTLPAVLATNYTFTNSVEVTLGATDADADPLTFSILTNAVHGVVSNFNAAAGTFTYYATNDFIGTDVLTFAATDGLATNAALVTLTALAADADGDGLPDAWETLYGFNPGDPEDAGLDFDSDGQSNLAEFFAGTDPLQFASALRLVAAGRTNNVDYLTFPSVPGRNYYLQGSPDLSTLWTNLGGLIPGTGTNITLQPTNNATRGYYRVILVP